MNTIIKPTIIVLLSTLSIMACSSGPEPKRDPYNDADSQRSRAGQAQDEMSRDTSR